MSFTEYVSVHFNNRTYVHWYIQIYQWYNPNKNHYPLWNCLQLLEPLIETYWYSTTLLVFEFKWNDRIHFKRKKRYHKDFGLVKRNSYVRFASWFRTASRNITSNWRGRHSECTCGTMNSDPLATIRRTTTIKTGYEEKKEGSAKFGGGYD